MLDSAGTAATSGCPGLEGGAEEQREAVAGTIHGPSYVFLLSSWSWLAELKSARADCPG